MTPQSANIALLLGLFLGSVLLRLPFMANSLVNWDSVNFVMGTLDFDLQHSQPHAPGYIGYVALGAALNRVTGNPITSLTLLSAVSSALAVAMFFLLGRLFMPRPYAAIAAVLFAISPVVWYYSEVPLTYAVELALALAFLWSAYQARAKVSKGYLLSSTLLLVALGAVRQSGAVFLFPLWLYVIWAFPWPERRRFIVTLALGNLAWLVPLLWLAGGPVAYLRESAQLADSVVRPVSIFAFNIWGLMRNTAFVLGGTLVGLNLGVLLIVIAHLRGANPLRQISRKDRMFFLLWAAPALLTYLLIHTGQLGYMLLLMPLGFLWAALALRALMSGGNLSDGAGRQAAGFMRRPAMLAVLAAAAIACNVLAFLFLPGAIYAVASVREARLMHKLAVTAVNEGTEDMTRARARQYDLRLSDAYWGDLVGFINRFNPETTAVLAVPDGAGGYRQLSYYVPDYHLYGLGTDQNGSFGHLFTARGGKDTYNLNALRRANTVLLLPPKVRRVIIPDAGIYQQMGTVAFPQRKVTLRNGSTLTLLEVPSQATLVFSDGVLNSRSIEVHAPPVAGR